MSVTVLQMKSTSLQSGWDQRGGCPALNIYIRSGDISGLWDRVIQIQG